MDAWTFVMAWYRRFGKDRILHATAHDLLMRTLSLGDYFRAVGVIPASGAGVSAALPAGRDVVVWPGEEQDAMRAWRRRDEAMLAGRAGFVRQAICSRVPIAPVATVGGHDTVLVLSEGRWLADLGERMFGPKRRLRAVTLPIISGFPFPLALAILPAHLPRPAKLRTEVLDPIHPDPDPERADDPNYVASIYHRVATAIQIRMDRLAARPAFQSSSDRQRRRQEYPDDLDHQAHGRPVRAGPPCPT